MRGVVRVFALILNGPPRALPPAWAVTLRGVSPEPGSTVILERVGRGAPVVVAQATADADGSFSFTLRPVEPTAFRARVAEARSPVLRVAVKPNVAVALAGRRLLVSTTPKRAGSTAALQLYDRERFDWVTVAKARLDSASRATLHAPAGAGASPSGRPRPRRLGRRRQPDARNPATLTKEPHRCRCSRSRSSRATARRLPSSPPTASPAATARGDTAVDALRGVSVEVASGG